MVDLLYREAFRDYLRVIAPMELESRRWGKVEPGNIMRAAEACARVADVVHRLIEIEIDLALYTQAPDGSDGIGTPHSDYHDLWCDMDPTEAARAFRTCAIAVIPSVVMSFVQYDKHSYGLDRMEIALTDRFARELVDTVSGLLALVPDE